MSSTYTGASDPHGGASATPDAWIARIATQNPVDAAAIVAAYQQYGPVVNYAADLALAQALLETGTFTSPAWRAFFNPAGIGITGDNVAGPNFRTIARGVQAHLALLNCYFGDGTDPWGVLAPLGGFTEGFTALNQMDGVWAVPGHTYGEEIAQIANEVIGGVVTPAAAGPVTLSAINRVAHDHLGKTLTDEGNAEFGMCEQEFEEWCEEAGLPRVRYATAAVDGDVLVANGRLQTAMPPPVGAGVVFGRAFDPEGHICDADTYPFVITTYPGSVSRVDAVANGWYASAGFLGWFVPDGATLDPPAPAPAPAPEEYLHINGHTVGGGFRKFYLGVPEGQRLQIFGLPTGEEHQAQVTDPAPDGVDAHAMTRTRVVQEWERGILIYQPELQPEWQVVFALMTQLVGE